MNRSKTCECGNPKDKEEIECKECASVQRAREYKVGFKLKRWDSALSLSSGRCDTCGARCDKQANQCKKCYVKGVKG